MLLHNVKTISKTGIYIVPFSGLAPTQEAEKYAIESSMEIAFHADPEEFEEGSEVTLTLIQMRGKQFYDVMPISELSQY